MKIATNNSISYLITLIKQAIADVTYTLPTASSSTKGGIKVGSNLSISGDTLSADVSTSDITEVSTALSTETTNRTNADTNLQTSINTKQDRLTAGNNITISNNTISATDTTYTAGTNVQISSSNVISATDTVYTLPTASSSTLGGIKVGDNLTITSGVLSADVSSTDISTLSTEVDDLKKSVSNGKTELATAITGKGVETSADDSFSTMASNIDSIGLEVPAINFYSATSFITGAFTFNPLLDASNLSTCSYMFYSCKRLTTLDLSLLNTSNVTNMFQMFYGCSSLTTLDLSSFDTSNVTNMREMFYNCSSLTTLDLSSFDTSKLTNTRNMFYGCSSLTTLRLDNFSSTNISSYSGMFGSVPTTVQIYTNSSFASWLNTNFSSYTNITIV